MANTAKSEQNKSPLPPKLPPAPPRPRGAETPLGNIRVVDFTHFIAGPFATLMLADFGAQVIKIESAGEGDTFRQYPPLIQGEGAPYLWTNRSKSSVALNLKSPEGLGVAMALIEKADVVVENFSSGVMDRLGLSYAEVAKRKPDIIYCSVSAYGREGPFADRSGFDPIIQAESGFISMNGFPGEEAVRSGAAVMDMGTAMMAANAILAALIARQRTGKGQYVETNMIGTGINMLANYHQSYLMTGVSPTRYGNIQNTSCPVGAFDTADGRLYLACANDRTFKRLTKVFDRPDLATNPAFATSRARRDNSATLLKLVGEILRQATTQEWLTRMHAGGVPAGAIRTVGEALTSPEVAHLGILTSIPHPKLGTVANVGLPISFSETPMATPVAAPAVGQHTEEILRNVLGYDVKRIAALEEAGAFRPASKAKSPSAAAAEA